MQILDTFKDKFTICETVYKVVLSEYISQNNIKIKGHMKVNMRQAPAALAFAGYSFDKDLLKNLFGSESSSIKKLRDKVTHGSDESAVDEIVRRKDELFGYMDTLLSTIKEFDAVVA